MEQSKQNFHHRIWDPVHGRMTCSCCALSKDGTHAGAGTPVQCGAKNIISGSAIKYDDLDPTKGFGALACQKFEMSTRKDSDSVVQSFVFSPATQEIAGSVPVKRITALYGGINTQEVVALIIEADKDASSFLTDSMARFDGKAYASYFTAQTSSDSTTSGPFPLELNTETEDKFIASIASKHVLDLLSLCPDLWLSEGKHQAFITPPDIVPNRFVPGSLDKELCECCTMHVDKGTQEGQFIPPGLSHLCALTFNGNETDTGVCMHGVATERGGIADKSVSIPRRKGLHILFNGLVPHCTENSKQDAFAESLSSRITIFTEPSQSIYKEKLDVLRQKINDAKPTEEEAEVIQKLKEDTLLAMFSEMEGPISQLLESIIKSHKGNPREEEAAQIGDLSLLIEAQRIIEAQRTIEAQRNTINENQIILEQNQAGIAAANQLG